MNLRALDRRLKSMQEPLSIILAQRQAEEIALTVQKQENSFLTRQLKMAEDFLDEVSEFITKLVMT